MVEPAVATVKPRVLSSEGGDRVQLLDVVSDLLATMDRGVIALVGSDGSGKTTALRHLAACVDSDRVAFFDEDEWDRVRVTREERPVVFAGNPRGFHFDDVEHRLNSRPLAQRRHHRVPARDASR